MILEFNLEGKALINEAGHASTAKRLETLPTFQIKVALELEFTNYSCNSFNPSTSGGKSVSASFFTPQVVNI